MAAARARGMQRLREKVRHGGARAASLLVPEPLRDMHRPSRPHDSFPKEVRTRKKKNYLDKEREGRDRNPKTRQNLPFVAGLSSAESGCLEA